MCFLSLRFLKAAVVPVNKPRGFSLPFWRRGHRWFAVKNSLVDPSLRLCKTALRPAEADLPLGDLILSPWLMLNALEERRYPSSATARYLGLGRIISLTWLHLQRI